MKRNFLYLTFFVTCLTLFFSCKDHILEDFNADKVTPVTVSAGSVSGTMERDNEKVILHVGVRLSAPATKAFQINLTLNSDTINTLIANNTLQNTVLLPSNLVKVPNVAEVSYGVDSVFFPVQVNLTALEQYFGKKVAVAVSLNDPTKGNQVGSKKTSIIVLDTRSIVKEEEIHYLSIKNGGGGTLNVTRGLNYNVTSAGVTIPLGIVMAGIPGSAFTIKTLVDADTVATLVAQNKLPANTIALTASQYLLDSVVNFPGNKSELAYELSIPWNVMDQNLNNPIAFVISLKSSNKHVLHPVNKRVIVLIDPSVSLDNNSPLTGNGTGLKAEYFKGTQTINEGGRLPDLTRIDPQINFGGWRPFEDADDNWSSRWTGEFFAPVRGEYTFYQTRWDDGARLFINGVTIVNDFTAEWDKPSRTGKIKLERGQWYPIEVHHRENVGGQQAFLEYEVAGAGIGRVVVPKSQLRPAP